MGLTTKPRGEYLHHTTCRLCQSRRLVKVLDFGDVPLAGAFLKPEETPAERFYPLEIHFCQGCTLVQVPDAVPGEVLFRKYFFFSSAIRTLVEHFAELAAEIAERFTATKDALVVELGCNDGVLLRPLHELGLRCVGVDPATNVVELVRIPGVTVVNDFFTEKVATGILNSAGPADVIVSSYSFAHIDDMVDVMKGIEALLKPDGVFVFEVYYLGIVLDELQYDMMYHEHMSYYSLRSLELFFERFEMEVFDVEKLPLRAGTIRYYVQKRGGREPISPRVHELREYELGRGYHVVDTFLQYAARVEKSRADLVGLLTRLRGEGKRIIGYGASGRATMIMNYGGIDTRYLDFVVDDAPAKQGWCTPGTHVPIESWSAAEANPPDYAVVFAWSFLDEVIKKRAEYLRRGGKFIVPLPEVRVVSG